MEFADVDVVCTKFAHSLQIPNRLYSIQYFPSAEKGEIKIEISEDKNMSLVVSAGSVSTLYTGTYNEEEFFKQEFDTELSLLYILTIAFYSYVGKTVDFSFEDILSLVLGAEVGTWLELLKALCDYVELDCTIGDVRANVEDSLISYDADTQILTCDNVEFQICSFVDFVKAIFKLVDYFKAKKDDEPVEDEPVEEIIEAPEGEEGTSIMNISPDFSVPTGIEETPEVEEVSEVIENEQLG